MKKIISKEIIAEVLKSYNELAAKNLAECTEYQFNNVENFSIGLVTVVKHGTSCMLNLKTEANKAYMAGWKKDIGALLAKDFRKNAAQGKYFEFKTDRFDHLKLGDYYYTIIIHTGIDTPYLFSSIHIDYDDLPENTEEPEDDYVYTEEPEQESLSLFD